MSEVTASASILRDSNEGGIAEVKNGDSETIKDEAWIVSTKTRRLAPSFTLSRKDLGADSSRNAESSSIKKKVIRFSRDDMLRLWKPSKILPNMTELPDIVSIPSLDPMGLRPLEQADVMQLWYAEKDKVKDTVLRVRVKGRGKGLDDEEEEDGGEDNEWSRGQYNGDKDGPWDVVDGGAGGSGLRGVGAGLDLADFAAAALKFRSDTRGLGHTDSHDSGRRKVIEEDEMDMLFREQKEILTLESLEEDDAEPEWADAYQEQAIQSVPSVTPSEASRSKRDILFETLNMSHSTDLGAHRMEPLVSIPSEIQIPVMSPMPTLSPPESWFYRDPQNTVQGPYETASMRQWHEARYFTHDLPIKLRHWNEFHPLGAVYANADNAFGFGPAPPEPHSMQLRHSHGFGLGPPPMRPLQSEIMDIDIILRQQQEQRQQIAHQIAQQQQHEQQVLLLEQRQEEQRRLQLAQMQAMEEQREAEAHKQQQLQMQLRQQLFEAQEREKAEHIRQARYDFEREEEQKLQIQQQQQQLLLQQQQQQLMLQQQQQQQQQQQEVLLQEQKEQMRKEQLRQQQLNAEQQRQQEQLQRQLVLQQQQHQQLLQQQQQQQQAQLQKVKLPTAAPASGPAWGGGAAAGPTLAQIQSEESKLKQQQQQQQFQQQQIQQQQQPPQQSLPSRGSSLQLKSLLGLGGFTAPSSHAVAESNPWESTTSTFTAQPNSPAAAATAPHATSLKEILRQEQAKQHEQAQLKHHQALLLMQQQVRSAREIAAIESATAAVIAASSWSTVDSRATGDTATGSATKPALSLRDIMQLEEASSAASQSSTAVADSPFVPAPRPAVGSWAAKASSTSTGSGNGSMVASVSSVSTKQAMSKSLQNKGTSSGNGASKTAAAAVSSQAATSSKPVQPATGPSFGSGHSCPAAELSEWCVAQLSKIRAADSSSKADPTEFFGVLEYCATLQSAVEVRETFSAYLGSTILVSNFATEFLKKKDGQVSTGHSTAAAAVSTSSTGTATGTKKKGKKGNTEF